MPVRFRPSAPKWETVLEQFLFCFTLTHIKRNRRGGSENSPVDYFPDAAQRFRPFSPIVIKIFHFRIKQLNNFDLIVCFLFFIWFLWTLIPSFLKMFIFSCAVWVYNLQLSSSYVTSNIWCILSIFQCFLIYDNRQTLHIHLHINSFDFPLIEAHNLPYFLLLFMLFFVLMIFPLFLLILWLFHPTLFNLHFLL